MTTIVKKSSDAAHSSADAMQTSVVLSSAQKLMWLLGKLSDGANAANAISIAWKLQGEIDMDALQQALHAVVNRHEALRLSFIDNGGEPIAAVEPPGELLPLQRHDLAALDESARVRALDTLLHGLISPIFDMSKCPMLIAHAITMSKTETILLLVMHHSVSDGWSMGLFAKEISELYSSFRSGDGDRLPPTPITYSEYMAAQNAWMETDDARESIAYWQETMRGVPELLELPSDRPRKTIQSYEGDHVELQFPDGFDQRLEAFSRENGVTPFMSLLTCWCLLLSRLSGQKEFVMGTPIVNRPEEDYETMIGMFTNMLALRVDLTGSPSVGEMLERIRGVSMDAFTHHELPFHHVVDAAQPSRSLSYSPLVQAVIAYNNTPSHHLVLDDVLGELQPLPRTMSQFDISLALADVDGELKGKIEYATDIFDRSTIERWFQHYMIMFDAMMSDIDASIDCLPLLSQPQRDLIIHAFNPAFQPVPEMRTVHAMFERRVDLHPDDIALICDDIEVSYADLDRRANRLAHLLRNRGAGEGTLVAICMSRGIDLVVAVLAVFKCDAAYLPLDPEYPQDRCAYMIQDGRPHCVLTETACRDHLPQEIEAIAIDGEATRAEMAAMPDTRLDSNASTEDVLAYVIYTSGSTGRPKGVMVDHANVVSLLTWAADTYTTEELSGMLFCTSICFDLSIYELFAPLTTGGTAILVENALGLADADARDRVRTINTVPSAIATLLDNEDIPPNVIAINLAGEPMPLDLARRIHAIPSVKRLFNLYGPTETTTYSTGVEIPAGIDRAPSIGRPIRNTRIYVLDKSFEPVPIGVMGEVYIAGAGVARGYLNQPEMTAERFLIDPFSSEPGARMYKTGDNARWNVDGTLSYAGRSDDQVKLRGFRIELGEIEAAFAAHETVAQARAVIREDQPGNKTLVVYVVAVEGAQFDVEAVRKVASTRLPRYMLPNFVSQIDAIPLTPNGKLDRKSLPAPTMAMKERVLPRNPREQIICELFVELLGIPEVGVHDSFFDLGGHSLIAPKLLHRIRQKLGAELPITALFLAPTVAELSKRVEDAGEQQDPLGMAIVLRKSANATRNLICIPPALGFSWPYLGLLRHISEDYAVHGLQSRELSEKGWLSPTLESIADDLYEQVLKIQPQGPYYLLGWCLGAHVAHDIACRMRMRGEEVRFLVNLDTFPARPDAESMDREHLLRYFFSVISAPLPESIEEPIDWDAAQETLRKIEHPLGKLPGWNLERGFQIFSNNHHLMRGSIPAGIFDGDMHFIHAAVNPADPRQPTDAWQHHVAGKIKEIRVETEHSRMLHPGVVEALSRHIGEALEALD